MSRRKQENPQPRKRLINAEAELLQDTLTCGSCQKVFVLSEIVKFIQHKVHSCNKENNFILLEDEGQDSDREDPLLPGAPLIAPGRAPSISAPICNRKGLHHQHLHLHRNSKKAPCASPRGDLEGVRPPLGSGPNPFFHKKDFDVDPKKEVAKELPVIKQEVKDPSLRCSPKAMVNAYTNTIITEPSTYTCSTCKQTFTSAWVLVQHAQHMHGMKIYLVTPYHGSRTSSTSSAPVLPPAGPPPSLITANTTLGIPLPPVLPPCSMNGPTHHGHHHSVLPQQALSLENHPALQLLRMPLGERQFPPTSLNAPGLFARPSSQDFRVDMLAASSSTPGNPSESSQQFHRMNHHAPPHLPPHTAPSLPSLGIGTFEPHNPFMDRGPIGIDSRPRPPPMSLGFEPQMDFYSQRLRQLAGATSPTTVAAASPRKPTPPFTHPPMSSSSQPSTPTSTPQPVLNLHNSASGNSTPAPSHHNNNPAHRGSSASSTSSKGGGTTDVAEGSPKSSMKSWSCDFCGKAFRFESNLIVHRRSHTGEKPYKCSICTHSCSQASKLKRHMKTHQNNNNGKSITGSENNSLESPRSTPDSTSETVKDLTRDSRRNLDDDDDASDGQTADNEEEEEDLDDDEDEEEDELDDEEDLEDSMMAEDLSTRGPNSSTPVPRRSPSSERNKHAKMNSDDIASNNDNNSSNTISVSNGENGNNGEPVSFKPERHSLLSEVMDKIGLSDIQHYNEAYKKALEESNLKNVSKEDAESSKRDKKVIENGPEKMNHREDSNTNSHGNNNKAVVLHQHSMEFGHGFFGAFDYNHHHHHNAFEANKRLKLDIADHLRNNNNDRDSLYAGLWLPSVHGSSHKDVYDLSDLSRYNKSSSSESALKSVTPTHICNRSMSPRPGTSGGGSSVTPMPGLLVNSKNGSSKEQRRNDTCEYCGKVFKNCSNLTVHRRSHTGEKPYKCELCSYACAQSSKLTRHMKTHGRLGKDVYRCRFCDMPFSVPSTLEKHMRKCVVNQNAGGVSYMDRDSDSKDLS